ncbi:uncharacterized protein LY89DRAFT_658257 [Mollisia scopiformis]|uniref:Actin binding protein n=1 Tax=Mollisia scopiformis TaxID=149040 RepID=A0A132B9T7_MOLSC|nr:uncharacterized protein LY89DRAFT_658257 [Mollisia scopiformis]KUJ09172.1 hypothetical protein LY89DRAFT_658257 [Mollisia scopiformis]
MASLNTSTNGPSIKSSYQGVVNSAAPSGAAANSPTYGQWAIFSVSAPLVNAFQQDSGGKESVLKVQDTGEGELSDLIDEFSEGRVQFAFLKVKDPNTTLPKYVLIGWCGEGVPERTKGYFTSHLAAVSKILHGYHVQITARSDRDLTPESIVQKVADASGAKYSSGSAPPPQSSGPPPPLASKPVFNPTTRSSGTSGFNPLASSRSTRNNANVDDDGWGADAPPVTRSQLEKVQPAYKPTKVNMAELTKQKPEPTRFNGGSQGDENTGADVVKGGYQPIGKVDIAALRAQAKSSGDDRPTIVKGAYEPVGKVDIAAIKARAQKPSDDGPRQLSPAVTGTSGTSDEPKSLADRSAAFSQSERLTTLPKPKIANRFGSSASNFTGTKAPTPGAFGLQSAPTTAAPAPVGAASRTFANEGGKTPQQIWQEKKARERGLSGAGNITPSMTSPIKSQTSGGGEWKSGYSGKSWAPVATNPTGRSGTGSIGQQRTGEEEQEQEAPSSPVGGISAIRDRFKGGAPMGAPSMTRSTTGDQSPPPPPINMSTRPVGGVAMPGLPSRPKYDDEEEEEQSRPNIPPPPSVPRSPTPEPEEEEERESSPVRLAMPVSRSKEPEMEAAEELHPPPALPTSMGRNVPQEPEPEEEPEGHDTARGAGAAMAEASFGQQASTTNQGSAASGKRALISYDYEKAEDNELELTEGEYVTNIEMVDEDWWMGTNSKGESGLFPSNYVELVDEEEEAPQHEPEPTPAPAMAPRPSAPAAAQSGPTATALYDYEAAEDNELSFDEGAKITSLEFPDEDWWHGSFNGKSGLFPANYVQLDE